MYVELWMKKDVVTIDPKQNLATAAQLFATHKFRRLPVVENNTLVGIVSPGDIARAMPSILDAENEDETDFIAENTSVAAVMSTPVITIGADASLIEAITHMRRHKIEGLPVVNGTRLVGIISITNILDAFLEIMSTKGADTRFDLKIDHRPASFFTMIELFGKADKEILAILQHYEFSKEYQLVTLVTRGSDYQPLIDSLWANNILIDKITPLH
jgi:acetoin utilization protein AcuB